MAILNFTLSPESLSKLHDAVVCLGKFSEAVCIEAVRDKLVLTALNSTKSAYASFTLVGNKFFTKYQFKGIGATGSPRIAKFNCKIQNKALLSVFKGRVNDPRGDRETAVERCDVSLEDGEEVKSRLIVKIMTRNGILKIYRLTFESTAPMHAQFNKDSANNRWNISSKALREFVEHFGPGTEQLDIYFEDGRVSFTSYTDKVMSGNEVLKQPLHTTIVVDTHEFGEFQVEEKLHIVISVKDFKSIIAHAGITQKNVQALYSGPSSPMQIIYDEKEGLLSEFILMTIGEARAASATPAPNAARPASSRPAPRQALETSSSSRRPAASNNMLPPMSAAPSTSRENARNKPSRPSPPPQQPTQDDSLFVPADDDRRWDPMNFEDEDENEMLLWDQNAEASGRLQNTETQTQTLTSNVSRSNADANLPATQRVEPTQRMSDVRGFGFFDD